MSIHRIPNRKPFRKSKADNSAIFRTFPADPLAAIREEWAALRQEEADAPEWLRGPIARRRMTLLLGYPEREIPSLIDELNRETEVICAI